MPEAKMYPLPGATNETWRAWLTSGVRRDQGDRRRIRGAHTGLKRMLVEGMRVHIDRPYSWKEFSDALVRQAVGDAIGSLERRDAELVKLAYFGGLSNREISTATGLPQGTIERRLRHSIATIAQFVERGRGLGQRALGALIVGLSARWFHESVLPVAQATAVAGMAAIMMVQPSVPAPQTHAVNAPVHQAASPESEARPASPPLAAPQAASVPADQHAIPAAVPAAVAASIPAVQVPVSVPVTVPALPQLPVKVKTPQL
ncbi:MAG TPA: sigma-70 family RNA polymerase sigma factor [Candidatus Dormibacteraeota bacterium]|nr:sigma-70 family RNA polymerase sigma factor [Candidatus Dormibacteraeota bacterium]